MLQFSSHKKAHLQETILKFYTMGEKRLFFNVEDEWLQIGLQM